MNDKPAQDANFFIDLVLGYRAAKVVLTAHSLGLFAELEKEPRSAESLARALNLDERATKVLMHGLAAVGLVEKTDNVFRNTRLANTHLIPGRPAYLGSNMTYQELLWDGWSSLEKIVRSGKPQAPLVDFLTRGPKDFPKEYLKSVETVSRAAAEELANQSKSWPLTRMLDVGGGLGTYSRAFAAVHPSLEVTLLDLPVTLKWTEEALANDPHRARIRLKEANYLRDDFGEGYDYVLFSHVTHDESFGTNIEMLSKAFRATRPGARIAIHDFVVDRDECGPLFASMFSVNMLVYTEGGQVYSVEDYRRMLTRAGFVDVTAEPVLAHRARHPSTVVMARRP